MNWLLWKDYRHNRLIVLTALFLLLLPHLGALGVIWWAKTYGPPNVVQWRAGIAIACFYSIGLSVISLALIGGNAIAGERADRSAEFLYSLPIARSKLLVSKLLLALLVVAIPWLVNLPLSLTLTTWLPENFPLPTVLATIAIAELASFCVAWLVSSLSASASLATLTGLLFHPVVVWSIGLIAWSLGMPVGDSLIRLLWKIICLTVAPICFAVGTWHYLRRVEP